MAIITPITDDYVIQMVKASNPNLPVAISNQTVRIDKVTIGTTRVETWVEGTNVGVTSYSDTWVGKVPITTLKLDLGIIFSGLNGLVRLAGEVPTDAAGLTNVLKEYFGVEIPIGDIVINSVVSDGVGKRIVFSANSTSRSYYGKAEVYLRPPFIDFDTIPVDILDIVSVVSASDWHIEGSKVCPNLNVASQIKVPRVLTGLLMDITALVYTDDEKLPVSKILDEALRLYCFNLCGIDIGTKYSYVSQQVVKDKHYRIYQIVDNVTSGDFINIYF